MTNSDVLIERLSPTDHCLYFKIDGANYRLSPWSKFLQCAKRHKGTWHPFPFEFIFRTLRLEQPPGQSSLLDKFIESIPEAVRTRAIRFNYLQEIILKLMSYTNAAVDLADSNPILLWLIAWSVKFEGLKYMDAQKLIEGKQRIALKQLFPEGEGISVSFTKKMQGTEYDRKELCTVDAILEDSTLINSLRHYRQIKLEKVDRFIHCFKLYNKTAQIPFIKRFIASEESNTHLYNFGPLVLTSTMDVAAGIGHSNPQEALRKCSNLDQIRTLRRRWLITPRDDTKHQGVNLHDAPHLETCPPVASGTEQIEPITSLLGLFSEGEEMKHCVYSTLADEVREGKLSVYRVLAPERGTLALANDKARYKIKEFKLAANKEPNKKSWKMVKEWVKRLNALSCETRPEST